MIQSILEADYFDDSPIEPDLEADIDALYMETIREQLNSEVEVMSDEEQIHDKYLEIRAETRG
jgi:hypothetical protein